MKKRLNNFLEDRLGSLMANIHLFNSRMEPFNTSRTSLKKAIKTDIEIISSHYDFKIRPAMFNISLCIDGEDREISCIFGVDLYSQLVFQGLGDVAPLFENYTIDFSTLDVKNSNDEIILYNNGYIPTEYVYIPAFETSVNGVSIKQVKDETGKIYTVYLVRKKFFYVNVED